MSHSEWIEYRRCLHPAVIEGPFYTERGSHFIPDPIKGYWRQCVTCGAGTIDGVKWNPEPSHVMIVCRRAHFQIEDKY